MDLLFVMGGVAIFAFVAYTLTNWNERRQEYRAYRAHPMPPQAGPAGSYRQFVRLWRRHRKSYPAYVEKKSGERLALGAYLRSCELTEAAAAESPSGAAAPKVDSGGRRSNGS